MTRPWHSGERPRGRPYSEREGASGGRRLWEKPRQVGSRASRVAGMANRPVLARHATGWRQTGQGTFREQLQESGGKGAGGCQSESVGSWGVVCRTGQDWRHLVGVGVAEKLGVSHERSMRSQFHLVSGNLLRGASLAPSRLGA